MEDYIDILLEHLSEFQLQELGYEYFAQKSQEEATLAALEATFSDTQRTLFLHYEAARNATASISESSFVRQAFLLAREIYR